MKKEIFVSAVLLFTSLCVCGQQKKYPSLLWEITGKGLQKPSYLFGTMHVSSKMVFHLSDSFYYAIKNVDEVALEQNPLYWQRDMMRVDNEEQKIGSYLRNGANNYINEKSFQFEKYEDDIKAALTDEPQVVNGLLYRNYQAQADYEENTYLDLYIYQTGRKLGKKAAGVEDYYQTEKIVFEAYQDAMKDQNKKERSAGDESAYDIEKKIQTAYRQGDLDALDSLEKYEYSSPAFLEKFLYKRNEIQAHSIDTIIKHNSLFVGVGAAHLPGKRGVIEMLRKMGYHLRPVLMQDYNADWKDDIDKMKVPVVFRNVQTEDSTVSMRLPGALYKRTATASSNNESWQYADMENGTYYTIIRVNTSAALLGQTAQDEERKTDSLLYENIPGKIVKKSTFKKDGFIVFDITNRTRRGDLQRYNIIITPFEEIVCKMSGNEDYVAGSEADTFFHSIHLTYHPQQVILFKSNTAGFQAQFPQQPYTIANHSNSDNMLRWQWQAIDTITGNAYAVWKKTVNNYRFLEEDTFDLALIEESLKRSTIIEKELNRSLDKQNGYTALNMTFSLKNGGRLTAKAVLRGIHYYLVAAVSKKENITATQFIKSFSLTGFTYQKPEWFTDTTLHFKVQIPVVPTLDSFLMSMAKESINSQYWQRSRAHSTYMNSNRTAFFQNDSTGEAVLVNCTTYPKYYFCKDSVSFWKKELSDKQFDGFIIKAKAPYKIDDSCAGYKIILQDTNTVRQITSLILLKQNRLYRVVVVADTLGTESTFLQHFLNTFQPDSDAKGESIFKDKQQQFFADYDSKDSATHNLANDAVADISFTCSAIPQIQKHLNLFTYGEKGYFENKAKFIRELGFINDKTCTGNIEKTLSNLYHKTADTAYFQNQILMALARLKTAQSYDTLATLLSQDPPVFDDQDEYDDLFELMKDSLQLTKRLLPGLLPLSSIETYKTPVYDLLATLLHSNLIKSSDYESFFGSIYFDAKMEIKKMQNDDEKLLQKDDDDNRPYNTTGTTYNYGSTVTSNWDALSMYSTLLIPFFKNKVSVPLFFQKLLASRNPAIRLGAAIELTKNNQPVANTIWSSLASIDKYRVQLFKELTKISRKNLFPTNANTQEAIAKSVLLNERGQDKFQGLQLISKQLVNTGKEKGYVYFFLYKINKDDDWKMGLSGLQPTDMKEVSDNDKLTKMTDKAISESEPVTEQFKEQLKELLFSTHESAYGFFIRNQYNNYHQGIYTGN